MVPVETETEVRSAKRPIIAVSIALLASLLAGCGPEPQAPSPTLNPHPHEFTKMKIVVEPGSGVTGVKVQSLWIVRNTDCTPHERWPSGVPITKQVNVPAKVDKTVTGEWIATTVDDRFRPGKCQWNGGGYDIRFMHDQIVLSSSAREKSQIEQSGTLKLTCTFNEPHGWPGVCFNRDQEAMLRARGAQIFNATVELVK